MESMLWLEKFKKLNEQKKWNEAIDFMEQVIKEQPSLDAYLSINFLLMDLLVEGDYDSEGFDAERYERLLKHYFRESYSKYSQDPEYLFYMATIAVMSEWYVDLSREQVQEMLIDAMKLAPENLVYQRTYYLYLHPKTADEIKKTISYAQCVLDENSPIQQALKQKGPLGEYILGMMIGRSEEMLEKYTSNFVSTFDNWADS